MVENRPKMKQIVACDEKEKKGGVRPIYVLLCHHIQTTRNSSDGAMIHYAQLEHFVVPTPSSSLDPGCNVYRYPNEPRMGDKH